MSRPRRRWWLLGAVVLAVVAAGVVGAGRLVPKQKVREFLTARVQQATGAEVFIGEAGLRPGPGLGLRLRDCRIVGDGAALAAASGSPNEIGAYEWTTDAIDLRLAVLPLLRRRVVISAVRLSGPRGRLEHRGREFLVEDFELHLEDLGWGLEQEVGALEGGSGRPPGQAIPGDLALSFDLNAARVVWQGAAYSELAASGDLAARVLTVASCRARRGAGVLSGEARLDYADDPWGELVFTAAADAVPAADLLGPWAPELALRLDCLLSGRANGRCELRDQDTVRRTLDLTGTLTGASGVLHAADWLGDVAPYLGRRQDLKDIDFGDLHHEARIKDGYYLVDSLRLSGGQTDWTGEGAIALEGLMDVGLHVRLPAGFTPELGQWSFLAGTLRDAEGRVKLDFKLTGPVRRPQMSVDLKRMLAGDS